LVSLIQRAEAGDSFQVLVFSSAHPDYFISHVDLTRVAEYRAEAAKLTGEASIALLFHHLSASRLVTIAQIEGRVRGAGSEFVLACDMRFAARETTIFAQFEPAFGVLPGGGAAQHLTRLMGRGRALEVMLSAEDYDAELAERYGWINRALPADELGEFVRSLAHRIAGFPAAGHSAVKDRVNAIALAPAEDFRRDSDLFGEGVRDPEAQGRIAAAMKRGLQTRDAELALAQKLADWR
jgi:enoyl-CoA hydratase/carnithine racemase